MPTCYRIKKNARPRQASDGKGGFPTLVEALDEEDGRVLATCAFTGRAALSELSIVASDRTPWTVRPSRKVMPTRWRVIAAGEHVVDLRISFWRGFLNPLRRTLLRVSDPSGRELFRVTDTRRGVLDRLIGSGPREWMFMRDGQPVGKLMPLGVEAPRESGWFRRLLSKLNFDHGVVSLGDTHVLPAPAAIALVAIHLDLTEG